MANRMIPGAGECLRDSLEQRGIARNTIVIFTSDNGDERFSDTWPFSGKRAELLEGGLRIPAIVEWPGRVRAGSTSQQVSMSMDWLPTLLAAAGTGPIRCIPPTASISCRRSRRVRRRCHARSTGATTEIPSALFATGI